MTTKPSMITLLWFACLSMLGFLATDMYLPAFETIRVDYNTTQAYIGLSLSVFLFGLALGQLIYQLIPLFLMQLIVLSYIGSDISP